MVFEGFNKNPNSPRAMFGAGRYDNLLELFGKTAPAIGFGIGDVTWSDFLTEWDLWPTENLSLEKTGIMASSNDDLLEIYTQILPKIDGTFEIDTDYQRSENKRFDALKKRGCTQIIKIGK
jgi:histidyl-tRNA synthetase